MHKKCTANQKSAAIKSQQNLGNLCRKHESNRHTTAIIAPPATVGNTKWANHQSLQFNKPGIKVLGIGAGVISGANFRGLFDKAEYQSNSANL